MNDCLRRLLSHHDVTIRGPATPNDIAAVGNQWPSIPDVLLELWSHSDGIDFHAANAHILGARESVEAMDTDTWFNLKSPPMLPVLDDHESNYCALFLTGVRSPRIAFLPHDDGSRLLYTRVESLFDALVELADAGMTANDLYEAVGDYQPDTKRTNEDRAAAKQLLSGDHKIDEWNHAIQLLDGEDVEGFQFALESDHFVRRDARDRMKKMRSPRIQELLSSDQLEFDEFAQRVALAANQKGLQAHLVGTDTLKLGKKVHMNLDAMFYRRRVPNAIPRIMAWFDDVLNERDPRERPDHLYADVS